MSEQANEEASSGQLEMERREYVTHLQQEIDRVAETNRRMYRAMQCLADHPLIMQEGGTNDCDRAVRVMNKQQTELERLREQLSCWQEATGTSAANAKHWVADVKQEIERLKAEGD